MTQLLKSMLGLAGGALCFAAFFSVLPAEPAHPAVSAAARRDEAFRKAYQFEQQQNYAEAIETLRASPRNPPSYPTELRLAWLYYCAGNYANARRQYALAGRINSQSLEPWVTLQLPQLAQERYSDVEQTARQVLAVDSNHYYSNLRYTYACRMQGRNGPAKKLNRKMLALYPADVNFLLEQALALAADGEADKAWPVLAEALRVSPFNAYVRRVLTANGANLTAWEPYVQASKLEGEAKYQAAAQLLENAWPDPPNDYFYALRLGWLQYLAGDYERSRQWYEAAVSKAPEAIEPLLGLLYPLLAAEKYAEAEGIARCVLAVDPLNYTASLKRAYALRMQGRFATAEEVSAQLLTRYPSDVSLLLEQALAVHAQGRIEAARALYQRVAMLQPDNPSALAALAPAEAAPVVSQP